MGLVMILLLVASIVLIVVATSVFKLHPFIALIFAALFVGLGASALGQFDVMAVETTIQIRLRRHTCLYRNRHRSGYHHRYFP